MSTVKKAVIPAAGWGTRFLPATKAQPKEMLPIVDKPTIQYIIEEAVNSGIEEILIITNSQKHTLENHFDKSYELEEVLKKGEKHELLELVEHASNLANIHYIRQKEAKGLGHAILCAKAFINNEPFAVLLGDDIVDNGDDTPALKQLIEKYDETKASIIGVQSVADDQVSKYGIVTPSETYNQQEALCQIVNMVEKPAIDEAPSNLAGMGRYVLSPNIFKLLETQVPGKGGEIQLTDSIKRLMDTESVYALNFKGNRYDVGNKFGFIKATLDFALKRDDLKEDVYAYIKELAQK